MLNSELPLFLKALRDYQSRSRLLDSNDAAVQELFDHAQAVGFAKGTDGKDRFDVRLAINARKQKTFLRPESFVFELVGGNQNPGHRTPRQTALVDLSDELFLGLFAQALAIHVLRFLLEHAMNDREGILGIVLFDFSPSHFEQLGNGS